MSAPQNPAAFPCSPGDVPYWNEGMTLRDYFAGQAVGETIAAVLEAPSDGTPTPERIAILAYQIADAMLAAREGAAS